MNKVKFVFRILTFLIVAGAGGETILRVLTGAGDSVGSGHGGRDGNGPKRGAN
jgi:hypothetical protein